ncbi:MAG: GAF domain-containing protein [Chloroflexi bacterium]|nr:GAF domain-containing protein [Chloroflexota bacterium]
MPSPLRILHLEDNPHDAELAQTVLQADAIECEVTRVETRADFLAAVEQGAFDLILADYSLPAFDGLAALDIAREKRPEAPFIFLSGTLGEEVAVESLKNGARDYVLKNRLERLALSVRRALRESEERTARQQAEQALRQSEEKHRSVLENIDEIVYFVEITVDSPFRGNAQFVSNRVEKIIGCKPSDFISDPDRWSSLIHPDDVPAVEAQTRTIYATGQAGTREYRMRDSKTGEYHWMEDRVSPRLDEAGRLVGIFGVARDITERKQRERELEAIATVSRALRTAQTRAEMLPVILDQLVTLLHAEGASLDMLDPISGDIVIELAHGAWAPVIGYRIPGGQALSAPVIATGQPYLNQDVRHEPRLAWPDLLGNIRAMAAVPLIAHDKTIGALWIGRAGEIADGEMRLLTAIADIAANAIYRAALHEQTEQRLERIAALHAIDSAISASLDLRVTLDVLLGQVTAQLRVDAADVLLLSPHTQTLEYAAGRGFRGNAITRSRVRLGEGHAGRAALERRIIHVPDRSAPGHAPARASLLADEGFIVYFGVPLIAKGRVKGVLGVFHRTPFTPDPEWLDFLETLAGQAAIAIDNAELFDCLQRSNVELALAYDATIEGWSRALDLRDRETEGHTQRVTEIAERLARAMSIGEADLVHIRRGALLHDIGKMGVPDSILLKPGSLTDDEWQVMRLHPALAYQMLSPIAYLRPALDIPFCHHEKWDGTGYPRGLQGEQIPLAARIFAVVDVWDALRSDRPYRKAWPEEKAREYIREQAGTHFDPKVVEVLLGMND